MSGQESQTFQNIAANFLGRGWSAAMSLAFIPIYIKLLGFEAYGLIGFYATLAGVFGFLDLGIASTLTRELARLSGTKDDSTKMGTTLRTLEFIYWGLSLVAGVSAAALSGVIAKYWLNTETIPNSEVSRAIVLMGVVIGLRLPFQLYFGGLMGLQRQVILNWMSAIMNTLRFGGAALLLWKVAPTITVFFTWQVLVAMLETTVAAIVTWRFLPNASFFKARFSPEVLRGIGKFAVGMAGFGIANLVLYQTDKIVVSKLLPLSQFGYYSLASIAVGGMGAFIHYPVLTALTPRLCQIVSANNDSDVSRFYHLSSQIVSLAAIPASIVVAVFSTDVLVLWTRDPRAAAQAHVILSLLALGNMLFYIRSEPWMLLYAHGETKIPIRSTVAGIVALLGGLFLLTPRLGATGAATASAVATIIPLIMMAFFARRHLSSGETAKWTGQDVLVPLATSFAAAIGVTTLNRAVPLPILVRLGLAGTLALVITALASGSLRPHLRALLDSLRTYFGGSPIT